MILAHDRRRVVHVAVTDHPTVVTAPRSPWQNAYVERFIGSIRPKCHHHIIRAMLDCNAQLRNAFPNEDSPSYLLHDRDGAFAGIAGTLAAMQIHDRIAVDR